MTTVTAPSVWDSLVGQRRAIEALRTAASGHGMSQAFLKDYYVVFTSDCSATFSQAAHDATLHNIDSFFGEVVTSEQVMACWPAVGGRLRAAS
jgi:hypothetical protein